MMSSSSSRLLFRCCQLGLALLLTQALWAQGLRAPAQGGALRPLSSPLPVPLPVPASQRLSSDFIVAVVGSEPITNLEVTLRAQAIEAQLRQQGQSTPPREQLLSEVLDQLIQDKAQLQWAREIGVQVSDAEVSQAEDNAAERAQMTPEQLRTQLERSGVVLKQWRQDMRDQLTLQRLREREVTPRIRPTDQEIDQYLRERQTQQEARQALSLAQILIAVPDNATPSRSLKARPKPARCSSGPKAEKTLHSWPVAFLRQQTAPQAGRWACARRTAIRLCLLRRCASVPWGPWWGLSVRGRAFMS